VQVTVRPPGVVPGLAAIIIRTDDDADRVTTQAAVWNLGSRGAPAPDDARRSPGDGRLWTSELWLMTRGSYAINVSVSGSRGSGSVTVPFTSVATRQLGMSSSLGWLLGALGVFLVAGLVSIIGTAARESIMAPGMPVTPRQRRRGRVSMAVGATVLALALMGGRAWWNGVDADYSRSLFRPMDAEVRVTTGSSSERTFHLRVTDPTYVDGRRPPIIPDHGKPMHLFLIREDEAALGHLHPAQLDRTAFAGSVPALPAGDYRYYADVVLESGAAQTLTGRIALAGDAGKAGDAGDAGDAGIDSDDAVFVGTPATDSIALLPRGIIVTFGRAPNVVAGDDVALRFTVRDSSGGIAALEPYMGMPGHAMVARDDGEVFAHLHSNGSFPLAALQVLEAVERGDTLPSQRPNVPRPRLGVAHQAMAHVPMMTPGQLEFPFAFPSPGAYAIWVQFRLGGVVRTAACARSVSEAR
jgi:hypothetical protein